MEEWVEGSFEVWSPEGSRTVHGVVLAAFGVHHDSGRDPPGWVVAHTYQNTPLRIRWSTIQEHRDGEKIR